MSVDIQRAPDGTCQYLTKNDAGKNCECGGNAVWQGRAGRQLLYCDHHGRYASKHLEVIALKAGPDGRRETLKPWKEYRR